MVKIMETKNNFLDSEIQKTIPVVNCVQKGDIKMMKKLIENGANNNIELKHGQNIFHIAAVHGHTQMIGYLHSDLNMDMNVQCEEKYTPMLLAAENNHFDALNYICSEGADASLRN